MNAKSVRQAFLGLFARNGHEVVRSSSLVPANDPTLLFTNAGMVQFKDVFTGEETRPYKRATSSQKCVRAGGKHNDLENVGFTARHHTFFEMLGNFSFGDYFKADAIDLAWTFLIKELGLPRERLMFTVFGGDPTLPGIAPDDEARALWKKVTGVGDDRVVGLGAKDNFWQMGDTGPMGPCSEIHFWVGAGAPDPSLITGDGHWLEVWNLVFMQYERKLKDGPLAKLPAPSVDTGAGLERLACVIGGKPTNYDTDLFLPLIEKAQAISGKAYGRNDKDDASLRVIADHARATSFLVADGVFPDKTGREYVLRRIFRRAVRHGKRLGIEEPFMHQVCGAVVDLMGDVFPELVERRKVIEQIALEEETRFRRTLDRGLKLLDEEFERMGSAGEKVMAGTKVFQLYDTFGFPADLTAVIAAERGVGIDQPGFDAAMKTAQELSEFKGSDEAVEGQHKALAQDFGATPFLGYDTTSAGGSVQAILAGGARVDKASAGQEVDLVTDQSPFYGASGGQIGDLGKIVGPRGRVEIKDTTKPAGDLIVHRGVVTEGEIAVGDPVALEVDGERRDQIRANHSATHLLHLALKQVLGDHASQKGSLVGPDKLRFDFSHFAPLTDAEKQRIEDLVNGWIRKNHDTETEILGIDEAKSRGAVHMFGEKYGEKVRVVRIGHESLEFCGGTHVRRAGDIGLFKIVGETGIAQGVRRLEAVTGVGALGYLRRLEGEIADIAGQLRRGVNEVPAAVEKLLAESRAQAKEIADLRKKLASGGGRDLLSDAREVGGVKVLAVRTEAGDAKVLREVGDGLRDRLGSGILVLGGVTGEGKVAILAMVTKDLVGRFHAGKLAGAVAEIVGGKGGGRPDMAQAGGSDPSQLDRALAKVYDLIGAV
jgi:alanyl-tRNA synthetase